MKPRVSEFLLFAEYLTRSAPPDYTPWFFRCGIHSKAPATQFGSWKNPKNRLTVDQAVEWMLTGGNIGIAAMEDDPLVNVDLDGENVRREQFKLPTLMARSRSRKGLHSFYFSHDEIPNIPTDDDGEVRSRGQYVIAPGSYVPTDLATVPVGERGNAGYYTVEDVRPPAWIRFEDLPEVFKAAYEISRDPKPKLKTDFDPLRATGQHSALFDITAEDVVQREGGKTQPSRRWGSIFHGSTTDANMSLSKQGLLHCWRHGVSHNGLQALTVLSGYMTCREAGSPHRGSGAGESQVIGDNGAVFHAWLYAKTHRFIPEDDPIPVKALAYIAEKHLGHKPKNGGPLPRRVYTQTLQIVEDEY